MIARLGVNIDHVATLRQARGENYPSIVDAAHTCLYNGADQITIHLREDRRHIQDTDVEAVSLVCKKFGKPLNLEMGCNPEILDIALATNPEWVCLVPESRQEKTTEGGLDLITPENFERVATTIKQLKDKSIKVSLFVEAELKILEKCVALGVEAVEIHTGDFAMAYLNEDDIEPFLKRYREAHLFLKSKGVRFHAGHGLTDESVLPLLNEAIFEEYNIGHWIICQAVFDGLSNVVLKLKSLFSNYKIKG